MEFCAFSCDANHVFWSPRHIPNVIQRDQNSARRAHRRGAGGSTARDHHHPVRVAALSDAADGFLAKRYGWQSELGAVLDPPRINYCWSPYSSTLAYMKLVPRWLMAAAVARDVIIVLGALLYRYWVGPSTCVRRSSVNSIPCARRIHFAVVGREEFSVPAGVGGAGARRLGVRDGGDQRRRLHPDLWPAGLESQEAARRRACRRPAPVKQLALGVRLRADAVFESFWPGPNSEIVATLRTPSIVPLWLWGGSGTGKTHLLQAVCAAAARPQRRRLPRPRLLRLVRLVPVCRTPVYRPPVRRPLISRWPAREHCPLRLSRASSVLGCSASMTLMPWPEIWRGSRPVSPVQRSVGTSHPVIFAAAAPPRQPGWRLEDWGSRAVACVVYQLRELDDDGRIEALRLRAAQRGLQLPYETSEYLLKRMPRDMRSLFEILDQLDEASLVAQRRLTIPFIRDALERHARTKS